MQRPFRRPLASSVLLLVSVSATAQHVLHEEVGAQAGDQLGWWVGAAGDLDGDGRTDFGYGAYFAPGTQIRSGLDGSLLLEIPNGVGPIVSAGDVDGDGVDDVSLRATIYSGKDGTILRNTGGDVLVSLGDLDGDGDAELLAGRGDWFAICQGDHITSGTSGPGGAWVYSGMEPAPLYEYQGDLEGDALGGVVGRLGDVDGDGLEDFAVAAAYYAPCLVFGAGYLGAYSAGTGDLLWSRDVAPAAIAPLDDVDGDDVPDLALGLPFEGRVEFRSGSDGALLFHVDGSPIDRFGRSLEALGDVDGDGYGDLLVGAHQPTQYPGYAPGGPHVVGPGFAHVLSGADGSLLRSFRGDAGGDAFAISLAALGDVNADGAPDFVVGAPGHESSLAGLQGLDRGLVRVLSTRPLSLVADRTELSLTAGEAQTLSIYAGVEAAGLPALVVGSATGVEPGLPLGSFVLPLVIDDYFFLALPTSEGTPLKGAFGPLDRRGRGTAQVLGRRLPGGLADVTLFHAAVVLGPNAIELVSPAVPLRLVP